jgi:hypothetical protein
MTTLYKLTSQSLTTHNDFPWTLGVPATATATGEGDLCGPSWLHAYTDPLLAVLLNPIHANIKDPRLFRAEGTVGAEDHGLKVGCTTLTLVEEMPLPVITPTQSVAFGVICAKEVCQDKGWITWADRWLSGKDRTEKSARAAEAAAAAAAYRAAEAAGWAAAAYRADAAAAAYWAAGAAVAARAARAVAEAAYWAEWTAAYWAADKPLDLIALAHRAVAEF